MEFDTEFQFNSKDKVYEVIVKGINGDETNAVQFPYSSEENKLLNGCLINGEEAPHNLSVKTTYTINRINKVNILIWFTLFIVSLLFILYILNDKADEKMFLKIALVFGLFYIFATPAYHPLDESSHFFRAFLISEGQFYDSINEDGNYGGYVPDNYNVFTNDNKSLDIKGILINPTSIFTKYSSNIKFENNPYFSSTLPTGHAIPAMGIAVCRLLGMGIASGYYLGRMLVYAFFVACSYFAIKNMKYYKSIFFTMALIPIGMWLAGSIHLDPILNGAGLLFASICFKYYFDKDSNSFITKKDLFLIIFTAVFIITCKYLVGIPLLLLFFFIPKEKFKSLKKYIAFIILSVVIGASLIGWQFYLLNEFPYVENRNGNVNQQEQLEYVKDNIVDTIRILFQSIQQFGGIYLDTFSFNDAISLLGRSTGFIIILAAILEKNKASFDSDKKRKIFNIALFVLFMIVFSISLFALYLSFTPVGADNIQGYQFRYLISPLFLLLIPLANIFKIENKIENYEKILIFVLVLANINMILGEIIKTFSH